MFSYESQREGSTFGHGDATRGFNFGALYCGATRSAKDSVDGPGPHTMDGGTGSETGGPSGGVKP
jgi:hypothetical protein